MTRVGASIPRDVIQCETGPPALFPRKRRGKEGVLQLSLSFSLTNPLKSITKVAQRGERRGVGRQSFGSDGTTEERRGKRRKERSD